MRILIERRCEPHHECPVPLAGSYPMHCLTTSLSLGICQRNALLPLLFRRGELTMARLSRRAMINAVGGWLLTAAALAFKGARADENPGAGALGPPRGV